jgi:hypothetical protein
MFGDSRARRIVGAVSAGVLAATLMSAAPAHANTSRGYIDGASTYTDDLGDEATLSNGGSYWRSNATAMWQSILYSENLLPASELDCEFGKVTAAATRNWQDLYNAVNARWQTGKHITVTGVFDLATRNAVADWMSPQTIPYGDDTYLWYVPKSDTSRDAIQFHRHDGNYSAAPYSYDLRSPLNTSEWHRVTYGSAYFSFC